MGIPKLETSKSQQALTVRISYIIDRYDSLPENVIFHHAERFQWHNDNLDYDALPLLQKFKIERLKDQGYVNLRCAWVLGCPVEIRPKVDATPGKAGEPVHAKHVYKAAFEELFPGVEVPDEIGVNCCSQFGVRRETIKQRPKSEYIRYREWLKKSPLGDDLSGRVLEYSWHCELELLSSIVQRGRANMTHSDLWQEVGLLPQRGRVLLPDLWHLRQEMRREVVRQSVHPPTLRHTSQGLATLWMERRGTRMVWAALKTNLNQAYADGSLLGRA